MPNQINMTDIKQELEQWLKKQPAWIQVAASCIADKEAIAGDKVAELLLLCKKQANNEQIKLENIKPINLGTTDFGSEFRIEEMSDIEGVNALAPRKPLSLRGTGLHVIYGGNGSGNSGYVRILKHACGARNAGELLGNVYDKKRVEPKCTFAVSIDGQDKNIQWAKLSGVHEELSRVEIFDSSCGDVYITQENDVTYEPFLMALLSRLARLCDHLGSKLDDEIKNAVSKKPRMPPEHSTTTAFAWYEKLRATTPDDEINRLGLWDDTKQIELDKLHNRLAQPDALKKAASLRRNKTNVQASIDLIQSLLADYGNENLSLLFEVKKDATEKRKIAEEDAKVVFSGAPLKGVGSIVWKALWEAAREYSTTTAYEKVPFPFVGDEAKCVLCQSTLDSETKKRLATFEAFIMGALEKKAKEAEGNVTSIIAKLKAVPKEKDVTRILDAAAIDSDAIRSEVLSFCSTCEKRNVAVIRGAESVVNLIELPKTAFVADLNAMAGKLEEQAQRFEKDAKSENRKTIEAELVELKAQKWLSDQKSAVLEERQRLQLISRLTQARRYTNTQSISTKKSSIATKLITPEYVKRFKAELIDLGAKDIAVELVKSKVSRGRIYHQLLLSGTKHTANTGQILSEGEYRIVAIAAFLADVEGKSGSAPFVFDDPISSLDQTYEEATTLRLAKLSKSRQVIVFTHRLSMLRLLNDSADKEKASIYEQCIYNQPWGTGEPGGIPLYAAQPLPALNTLIDQKLLKASKVYESEGTESYAPFGKEICCEFRILLESIIESVLLVGIVHRFRRDIRTKNKIQDLSAISVEDCALIDEMMTKYSGYLHSQSGETPKPIPKPDAIKADLVKMKEWIAALKQRRKALRN